jgi:hypothetical protein
MSKMIDRINQATAELEAETARVKAGGAPKKPSVGDAIGAVTVLCLVASGVLYYFRSDIQNTWSDLRATVDSAYAERTTAERAEAERAAKEKATQNAWEFRLAGAHRDCENAVRQYSKFPSKAKFHRDVMDILAQYSIAPNSRTGRFRGRVDMMNGFGAMIPHRYTCILDVPNWKFTSVTVAEG